MLNNTRELPVGWRETTSRRIILRGGRLFHPGVNLDKSADLGIEDGIIKYLGEIPSDFSGEVVNCEGLLITPGLFDMHVHLREPGYEHKETVRSGCSAAAAGGFTGIACMPNTNPSTDNPGVVEFIRNQASGLPVNVYPIAATTKGRKGETLTEMGELVAAGVTAFSDDGAPVASADLMRRALEYANMLGALIIEHCEEPTMTVGGIMHEGAVSTRLGLTGWPAVAEEIAIERNIQLAEYTGARLHCAHVSTARGVELVREAKRRGVKVTAEVTPHHVSLECSILESYDSEYKVNPPLRDAKDIEALIEGLADGTIDAIATDHAPHAHDEKEVELAFAPFGMVGLETAFGIIYTELVLTGRISLARTIDAMSFQPRRLMNLPDVLLEVGVEANLSMFDLSERWTVDRDALNSKSHNTPFHGWKLTGRARGIFNNGRLWHR